MRVLLIFLSSCLLAGCVAEPNKQIKFAGWFGEITTTQHVVSVTLGLLVLLVLFLGVVLSAVTVWRRPNDQPAQNQSKAFPAWLAGLPETDPDVPELKAYSRQMSWNSSDLASLRTDIEGDTWLDPTQKLQRTVALLALHRRWTQQGEPLLGQVVRSVFDNGIGIFLSLFAFAVFISLAFGLSNSPFFSSLAHVDQARGLITFLVAVCAVAVIMLTAINIFWGNRASFEERFKAAKDLVTLVVGVLGTILGFYFGSLNGERALQLNVDSPSSYSLVVAGAEIDLKATARSGTPPYHYDVLLVDADNKATKPADNLPSDSGSINKKFGAPQAPGKYSVILLVRDAKGLQTKESIELIVKADDTKKP